MIDNQNELDKYRNIDDLELLYRYSRVSYRFERAVELMQSSNELQNTMLLMRAAILDRISAQKIFEKEEEIHEES